MDVKIDYLSGNCPVQGEGTVNGVKFYFRARGSRWSMGIGGDDLYGDADWYYEEDFGNWPDAGWMTEKQAREFISEAAQKFDMQHKEG